jgi:hypothetical protein
MNLLDVSGDQFGHFEHADLLFTVENGLKSSVGIDQGFLFRVLKLVGLDVVPELFGELGPRQRLGADDGRKNGIGLNRLHEGGIWFTGSFFGFRHGGASKRRNGGNATEKGKFSGVIPACKERGKPLAANFKEIFFGPNVKCVFGRNAGGKGAFLDGVAR